MCGISGWFSPHPIDLEAHTTLEQMVASLRHRGPDGNGCYIKDHAALGHTRLAIIDLDAGRQPMISCDGKVVITFNGEIYNYRHLRQRLENEGYRFQTHSDTEVIIAIYQTWGITGFNAMRGMYAFALWDNPEKTGYLVRDPLGIKPLFWHLTQNRELVFGSEAKAILVKQRTCALLNENQLHLLLNFRYLPTDASLFRGISQLGPGEIVVWQPERELLRAKITRPESDSQPFTLECLTDSVKAHFTADVEVGCYLSGGIDSAAICALGKSITGNPLKTFTLSLGDDPNEALNAQRSAELLGLENQCEQVDVSVDELIRKSVWHLEVPKVNALQVGLVARLAATKVKVVLSGLGGDELFCGYRIHQYLYRSRRLHQIIPTLVSRSLGKTASTLYSWLRPIPYSEPRRALDAFSALGDWPRVYGLLRNVWDDPLLRTQLYGPRMLDMKLSNAFELLCDSWPDDPDPVRACLAFEYEHKLVNDLLWQEDRLSMAHGLEVRVPFVDLVLKQSTDQLDISQLMRGGKLKHYLKSALTPILPAEIINRRKSGFQVDAPAFFKQHLASLAQEYLSPEKIRDFGLFNPVFAQKIMRCKPHKRLRWHFFMLYLMLLTHLWIEQFEQRHY